MPLSLCKEFHALDLEGCAGSADEDPPDPPLENSAAADGPRNGAKVSTKLFNFDKKHTASAAARHPISTLKWGMVT